MHADASTRKTAFLTPVFRERAQALGIADEPSAQMSFLFYLYTQKHWVGTLPEIARALCTEGFIDPERVVMSTLISRLRPVLQNLIEQGFMAPKGSYHHKYIRTGRPFPGLKVEKPKPKPRIPAISLLTTAFRDAAEKAGYQDSVAAYMAYAVYWNFEVLEGNFMVMRDFLYRDLKGAGFIDGSTKIGQLGPHIRTACVKLVEHGYLKEDGHASYRRTGAPFPSQAALGL